MLRAIPVAAVHWAANQWTCSLLYPMFPVTNITEYVCNRGWNVQGTQHTETHKKILVGKSESKITWNT